MGHDVKNDRSLELMIERTADAYRVQGTEDNPGAGRGDLRGSYRGRG